MKRGQAYYRYFLKGEATYKINFISYLFSGVIQIVAVLFIWQLVYASTGQGEIEGLTYAEIVIYTLISTVTMQFTSLSNDYEVAGDILEGNLVYELIRPVSYTVKLFFKGLAQTTTSAIVVGIPLLIGVVIYLGQTESLLSVLLRASAYLVIVLLSIGLMFCVNLLFGYSAFYLNYAWGFLFFKETFIRLLSGTLFPLVMLPKSIRNLFLLTPFQYLNYFPTMTLLGKLSLEEMVKGLIIQGVWLLILAGLCTAFWRHAIKKITINGG